MRRLNLPELEDQPWFPAWLRDAMTGYLQVIIEMARPYDVAAPVLASLLEASPSTDIVDLASGAGGPWRQLMSALRAQGLSPRVTFTDLSPNQTSAAQLKSEEGFAYHPSSVSAVDIPEGLGSVRTMFTALHHFSPDEVRDILRSAQRERVAFAGFEVTQRSWRGVILTAFIPLLVLVLMPRVKPRSAPALILTYLPPILPLLIWWDGLASTLRTHSPDELRVLATEIAEPGYTWSVEEVRVPRAPIPVLQIVGRPEGP